MSSEKNTFTYNLIDKITYDVFDQRWCMKQGNGVVTQYRYEPDRRRLKRLTVYDVDGERLMNNAYTYDQVNNIRALKNLRDVPNTGLGGPMQSVFEYDSLYRLVSAASYEGQGREDGYTLSMAYDQLHNITNKTLSDTSSFPWILM
ncbi:MAG: hypothetical protein IPO17_13290 [Flavobacteriales bacterium]|nr:hypothetical protein [Flavobacteriales bacterium]